MAPGPPRPHARQRSAFLLVAAASLLLFPGAQASRQMLTKIRIGAWSVDENAVEELRIGAVVTLSEDDSWEALCGRSMVQAYEMFANQVNYEMGGYMISGRRHFISITIIEVHANPATAREAAKRLLHDEGIQFLLGPCSASLLEPVADEANSAGALLIAPWAPNTAVFSGRPSVFGIATNPSEVLKPALSALQAKGVTRVAYFYEENSTFARSACTELDLLGASGLTIVHNFSVSSNENSSSFAAKVKALQDVDPSADLVVSCTQTFNLCNRGIVEMWKLGFVPKAHLATLCVAAPEFFDTLQSLARAASNATALSTLSIGRWVLGAEPWFPSEDAPLKSTVLSTPDKDFTGLTFAEKFKQEYGNGSLTHYAAAAWAALEVYLSAAKYVIEGRSSQVQDLQPTWLVEMLNDISQAGVRNSTIWGSLAFDSNGQGIKEFDVVQYGGTSQQPLVVLAGDREPVMPAPSAEMQPCAVADFAGTAGSPYGLAANGTCSICPHDHVASFNDSLQRRQCTGCPLTTPVRFVDQTGARVCIAACGAGHVQLSNVEVEAAAAGLACEKCPAGRLAVATSSGGFCDECHAGRFSEAGATSCSKCPHGKSAPRIESSSCQSCRPGTHSSWQRDVCVPCEPGKFQHNSGQSTCVNCSLIEGSHCPWNAMKEVENQAGFYMRKQVSSKVANYLPERCRFFPGSCLADDRCARGHIGRQCLSCEPGYASSHSDGCIQCPYFVVNILMTLVLIFVIVTASYGLARLVVTAAGRLQDMHAIIFKLLMNHLIASTVVYALLVEVIHESTMPYTDAFGTRHQGASKESYSYAARAAEFCALFSTGLTGKTTSLWSASCLTQPFLDATQAELIRSLSGLTHMEFQSPSFESAREALASFQRGHTLGRTLFWGFWPLLVKAGAYGYGFLKLRMEVRRRARHFAGALEFYQEVYAHGKDKAKKTHATKVWCIYVEQYFYKIWDLWWPISHASRYLATSGSIDYRIFLTECYPVGFAVYFLVYGSTVLGTILPLKCTRMSFMEDEMYIKVHPEVECTASNYVLWFSALFATLWIVIFPLNQFLLLRKLVRTPTVLPIELNRRYGLVCNGYSRNRWWWESVVFARKGLIFFIEVLPIPVGLKAVFFLTAALVFTALHVRFDPFDGRCRGILNKLECLQLANLIFNGLVIAVFSQLSHVWFMLYIVPTMLSAVNLLYTFYVVYHLLLHIHSTVLAYLEKSELMQSVAANGGIWQRVYERMVEMQSRVNKASSYVAVEPRMGWATICGSRGDVAEPVVYDSGPRVAKSPRSSKRNSQRRYSQSSSFDEVHVEIEAFDNNISDAPFTPILEDNGHVKIANGQLRVEIHQNIMKAIHSIATRVSGSTFSVSAIEFVLRAAFILGNRGENDDAGEEPDHQTWVEASLCHDPLRLVGNAEVAVAGGTGDDEAANESLLRFLKQLGKLEEDLRLTGAGVIKSRKQRQVEESSRASALEGVRSGAKLLGMQGTNVTNVVAKSTQTGAVVVSKIANTIGDGAEKYTGSFGKKIRKQIEKGKSKATGVVVDVAADVMAAGDFVVATGQGAARRTAKSLEDAKQKARDVVEAGADMMAEACNEISGGDVPMEGDNTFNLSRAQIMNATHEDTGMTEEEECIDRLTKHYRGQVQEMYAPGLFKTGMKTIDFEFAIVTLKAFPPLDLKIWWDVFEDVWLLRRMDAESDLLRSKAALSDRGVQMDYITEKEAAEEAAGVDTGEAEAQTIEEDLKLMDMAVKAVELAEQEKAEREVDLPFISLKWMRMMLRVLGAQVCAVKAGQIMTMLSKCGARAAQARALARLAKQEARMKQLDEQLLAESKTALDRDVQEREAAAAATSLEDTTRQAIAAAPGNVASADVARSVPTLALGEAAATGGATGTAEASGAAASGEAGAGNGGGTPHLARHSERQRSGRLCSA